MTAHPLLSYSIENFKAFRKAEVRLAPITVLIGSNSSGKSSVFQPLMLFKQTLESTDASLPLVLNGSLLELGSFHDIIYRHSLESTLSITFEWDPSRPTAPYRRVFFGPSSLEGKPAREVKLTIGIKYSERYTRTYIRQYQVVIDGSLVLNALFDPVGRIKQFESSLVKGYKPSHIPLMNCFLYPNQFLMEVIGEESKHLSQLRPLLEAMFVNGVPEHIVQFLLAMNYIPPLRPKPQYYYMTAKEGLPHLPAIAGSSDEILLLLAFAENKDLRVFTNRWLSKWGMADFANVRKRSFDPMIPIYTVDVHDQLYGINAKMPNVGFGISQVLAMLIRSFIADEQSLSIIEQPEIHLNPKVQAELADMFIELSRTKYFMIETHSEHFVLRLQRRIADGTLDQNDVNLYFVDIIGKKRKKRILRKLLIDAKGMIKNWPRGFFEDDINDRLEILKLGVARQ